jgi:hypothetical protein
MRGECGENGENTHENDEKMLGHAGRMLENGGEKPRNML